MIISLAWIKKFIELPADQNIYDIANQLTMKTAEVEQVFLAQQFMAQVYAVEVLSLKPHPGADKLRLVTFTDGKETREVVCGAPNVVAGMKVFYAPVGTQLPDFDQPLEAKNIRGVLSAGMLCSAQELKLESDVEGLLPLPSKTLLGMTLGSYLGQSPQELLEIDNKSLTHRPDLWGHIGFVRELATIYQRTPCFPLGAFDELPQIAAKVLKRFAPAVTSSHAAVELHSDQCLFFAGAQLDLGTEMNHSLAAEIKKNLESCQQKSVNPLADLSNYLMLEWGIPMHFYDAQHLQLPLKVENLTAATSLELLNGETVELAPGDLVIRSTQAGVPIQCLAGVMGGMSSATGPETRQLFLEVAVWKDTAIRRTSTRLGLRTEASSRYEKSLDPVMAALSFYQALNYLKDLFPSARLLSMPFLSTPPEHLRPYPAAVSLTRAQVNRTLGLELPTAKLERILTQLSFKVNWSSDQHQCQVMIPSFRATKDITAPQDLIEEIARMVGYDELPVSAPMDIIAPCELPADKQFQRTLQDYLVQACRAQEVMTYPLVGEEWWQESGFPVALLQATALLNPLTEQASHLRTSLVPGMLKAFLGNARYRSAQRLFEWGRIYPSLEREDHHLAMLYASTDDDHIGRKMLTHLEELLMHLGLGFQLQFSSKVPTALLPQDWSGLVPSETVLIQIRGKVKGFLSRIHPQLISSSRYQGKVYLAICDFTEVYATTHQKTPSVTEVVTWPSSFFDCCVELSGEQKVQAALSAVQKLKLPEIKRVAVRDCYHPAAAKEQGAPAYLTLRTQLQPIDATLTSLRIQQLEQAIIDGLASEGFPLKK